MIIEIITINKNNENRFWILDFIHSFINHLCVLQQQQQETESNDK